MCSFSNSQFLKNFAYIFYYKGTKLLFDIYYALRKYLTLRKAFFAYRLLVCSNQEDNTQECFLKYTFQVKTAISTSSLADIHTLKARSEDEKLKFRVIHTWCIRNSKKLNEKYVVYNQYTIKRTIFYI